LFSDQAAYFLTNASTSQKRVEEQTFDSSLPQIDYFYEEFVTAPNTQYSFNNSIGLLPLLQQSYYEEGEGWTGSFMAADTLGRFKIPLVGLVQDSNLPVTFEMKLNGRSRVRHSLHSTLNNGVASLLHIEPFGTVVKKFDLGAFKQDAIQLSFKASNAQAYDWYSVTYFKTHYPRFLASLNVTDRSLRFVLGASQKVNIRLPFTDCSVWEVSDLYRPMLLSSVSQSGASIFTLFHDGKDADSKVFFAKDLKKVNSLQKVEFMESVQGVDYLIITEKSLTQSAKAMAEYRKSATGGGYKVAIMDVEDIYNRFFYGEKSPEALKRAAFSLLKGEGRNFLFLLGRPVSFPDVLKTAKEWVPTYGYPGSDALFVTDFEGPAAIQKMAVGRLNVTKNEEVIAYLQKVKEFEAESMGQAWRKRLLHLSGGQDTSEMNSLKSSLEFIVPKAIGGLWGGEVQSKTKKTNEQVEQVDIAKEINDGLGMLTFVGHGSSDVLDFNIGFVSDSKRGYANTRKYPIMFFNGCGVGNIFYKYNPLSTDWLLTPQKGAIAVLANSFWSYQYPTQRYLEVLYDKFFVDKKTVNLTLGEILTHANNQLYAENADPYIIANVQQMVLQGDPALKVFPTAKPDYTFGEAGPFIQSYSGLQSIAESDSLKLGLVIQNLGRYEKGSKIEGKVLIKYQNNSQVQVSFFIDAMARRDTIFLPFKKDYTIKQIEVRLDDTQKLDEWEEANNVTHIDFSTPAEWKAIEKHTLFPENSLPDKIMPVLAVSFEGRNIKNGAVVIPNAAVEITLADERPLDATKDGLLEVFFRTCESCSFMPLPVENFSFSDKESRKLVLDFALPFSKSGNYTILVIAKDMAGNFAGVPFQRDFVIIDTPQETQLSVFPNPTESFVQIKTEVFDVEHPQYAHYQISNALGQILWEGTQQIKVGDNAYYLPLREVFGEGVFYLKTNIFYAHRPTEAFVNKVIVR
jgi:Peptidase family C25